jgi:hypothetical protein
MANRLVTNLALFGFFAWSLVGLVAFGLVTLGGDVLRFIAQVLFQRSPDVVAAAESVAHFLQALGGGLVISAWAAGSVIIAIGASVFRRLSAVEVHGARFDWQPEPWTQREMKDVTPPRDNTSHDEILRLPRPHDKN